MDIFRKNIIAAIKDQNLQAALDMNAAQRLVARELAYMGLDDNFEGLKRKAHAVRMEVIANLDRYLSEFIISAERNGFIVHHALDAAAARDLVLKITQQSHPKLITKSKTMMSEEIQLNPELEAAGIEVVETDLGEYIVQLRGEHPSHIITPAVHLRREDVGVTFHDILGIPLTDDVQILTNTARTRLRQKFLETDIGISGVNVGVANTGSLCIVTNEGNGRMVTTLPRIHIALMGIERLVPDIDGLALILTMLPRSATGQKTTVYTQLINGPRHPQEIDGAEERHLILIDNGRTKIRQSPLAESLLCIRCGACINACPVFREIGGYAYTSKSGEYTPYPGPIGSVLSPGIFGKVEFGHLAQASTLCGACKEACPMDIDLPALLLRVRSGDIETRQSHKTKTTPEGMSTTISWGLRLFTWVCTQPALFQAAQKISSFLSRIWAPRNSWMYLPPITGWGFSKDFPRPARLTFKDLWKDIDQKIPGEIETVVRHSGIASQQHTPTAHLQEVDTLVSRFELELTALDGTFTRCTRGELGTLVHKLLEAQEVYEILSWDETHLPHRLLDTLKNNGIKIHHHPDPGIRVGLTGVNAAIAETGTIVLTSGSGQPLTTSLLPDTHIAILKEEDIYKNLPQVLRLREVREASSVVLISGPSRTADIEMTLTIGVHGPGELHVFCVQ
jgi:L-lactate dehydrogenase complex protein LldF